MWPDIPDIQLLENISHVKHSRKIEGYFKGVFRLGLVAWPFNVDQEET
jgi:hypothetical protein